MSSEGGDTGGGDSGGGGKGGGSGGGVDFAPNAVDYTPYSPPDNSSAGPGPSSSGSDAFSFAPTSAGEQAGFQGGGYLPSEISTGSSGGGGNPWAAPTIDDFVGSNGFNLAGPGPVGGDNGAVGVHGGVFSSNTDSSVPLSQDAAAPGASAPEAGPGVGATAFAAPAGVSGTPDISSLVSDPNKANAPNSQSIFDSLNGAQAATVDQYADQHAADIPSATSTPAATSTGGGGNNASTGGLPSLSTNHLGAAVAGAGLLNNLVNGKSGTPAMGALNTQAAGTNATSADLLARG